MLGGASPVILDRSASALSPGNPTVASHTPPKSSLLGDEAGAGDTCRVNAGAGKTRREVTGRAWQGVARLAPSGESRTTGSCGGTYRPLIAATARRAASGPLNSTRANLAQQQPTQGGRSSPHPGVKDCGKWTSGGAPRSFASQPTAQRTQRPCRCAEQQTRAERAHARTLPIAT